VLVGLLKDGEPRAGIVRQPYLSETFVGSAAGAFLVTLEATTRLASSGRTDLGDAILYSTQPGMFAYPGEQAGFDRVARAVRMHRFGGDCYSYCLLAAGFIDLVIEGSLQAYDILPLIPIVEAAGGVVTDLDGDRPLAGGTVIAAASPELATRARALMRG
jgi:myo-inositol-1(or 4)-monophosphatase